MKKRVPSEQEIAKKHGVSVDYVIRQAEVGSTVEREHVTDHKAAYGIALQHIAEFPDYYKHLLGMEKKLKKEWKKKDPIKENVSSGNARRARFGSIKQRVGSSEVISNKDVANAAQKSADAKKSAGDAAHAAATKAGKSPMEAETARNRAHREYEKAQKKARLGEDHIPIAMGKMLDSEGGMIKNQLETIERSVELLRAQIKSDDMQIPAWVQAKVTLATENILTCANYMAGKDEEVKEGMKSFGDFIQESEAWQRKEGQNKNGGLNQTGRDSYNHAHHAHLKAPQPEGGPRKDSFCARMKGMKDKLTSKETANDPNSRINKSLRAWKC